MTLPRGIYEPTTPLEPAPVAPAGPGPETPTEEGPDATVGAKAPRAARARKGKPATIEPEKTEGLKLYLSEDVRFRLRMLAFKRGTKLSTVANEVLDRALPRWSLERTE